MKNKPSADEFVNQYLNKIDKDRLKRSFQIYLQNTLGYIPDLRISEYKKMWQEIQNKIYGYRNDKN